MTEFSETDDELTFELLFVETHGADVVLDAVTMAPGTSAGRPVDAGSPVTLVLTSNDSDRIGHALGELASAAGVCRVGTLQYAGRSMLVAAAEHLDAVTVILTDP